MKTEKKIRLMGIRPHRAFQRFIEKQMDNWISRERSLMFLPRENDYSVILRREGEGNYLCQIQIQIGTRYWEGCSNERTLQTAFTQAINHMKYVVGPTSSSSAPAHQTLASAA